MNSEGHGQSHYIINTPPMNYAIAPVFTFLDRKKKERKERERSKEGAELRAGALAPAALPGKGTALASHHTQPASAYVWARVWVHLLARERVFLCVTGRVHKERRSVSKQRIRKDNGGRARKQAEIKERVWVQNRKGCMITTREVMRSVTKDEAQVQTSRSEGR